MKELLERITTVFLRPKVSVPFATIEFLIFWLTFIIFMPSAMAVRCMSCKDNINPPHDTDHCPLAEDVTSNIAALLPERSPPAESAKIYQTLMQDSWEKVKRGAPGVCAHHLPASSNPVGMNNG